MDVSWDDVRLFLAIADHGSLTEAALQQYLATEEARRVIVGEAGNFPEVTRFFLEEVTVPTWRLLGSILERGIAAGEFRPTDADAAVMMIKGILITHVIWCGAHSHSPAMRAKPREQILHDIMDFVLHALRPVSPAAGTIPA